MDVKEIRTEKPAVEANSAKLAPAQNAPVATSVPSTDSVSVEVNTRTETAQQNQSRTGINAAIATINVAQETTAEISNFVDSLSGIIEQASSSELPDNRRMALEREANQLVEEIKKKIATEAPGGSRPLAGDKVRIEVEEKVRKTLETVLPDLSRDNLGLGTIRFSPREAIIETKINVETAKKRIDALAKSLNGAQQNIVASAKNLESSVTSNSDAGVALRDLDSAFAKADSTQQSINAEPQKALASAGQLKSRALMLLE